MVRVDCPLKDQSYRTCRGRWGQSCSPALTWPSCRHVPTAARFLVEASCPAVPRRGYWIIRVGRGFLSGIVEGGVGDAGARAADGVGRGVCFRRPSWRWRARADDESQPIGKIPPDWEDSIRSATSNMVESVPLARVSMVCVSPGTCRLARSTRGRTRQAAASMVRRTNTRLTDTTAHNARRRRLTSHEHTTLLRRGTNAADLADSSPASDATGEQRHRRAPEAECPYQAKRSPAHRACGAFTPPQ